MTATWPRLNERRRSRNAILIALGLSLLLHVYVWVMAYLVNVAFAQGWLPSWLQPLVQPAQAILAATSPPKPEAEAPQETWEEIPLQFIEVDPSLVTAEAPKDAKYTSTANTLAANPSPAKELRTDPRISGFREDTLKTFDTLRPAEKPQPAPPRAAKDNETVAVPVQAPQKAQPAREAQPERGVRPGETLLAKVDPRSDLLKPQAEQTAAPAQPVQEEQRPRYKKVAEARRDKGMLVGERMKVNGNVGRVALDSSFNVRASALGDYDYRVVQAVQERWYQLLDDRKFAFDQSGKVVVQFQLHADGTVSDVRTAESTVGDTLSFLCELAIMQPAPFGKWPAEVRRMVGGEVREVRFVFNYY